jgi:very-short-patch-repair endonuclease
VIRFWDHEVLKDMASVLERLAAALENRHASPLPERAREVRKGRSL